LGMPYQLGIGWVCLVDRPRNGLIHQHPGTALKEAQRFLELLDLDFRHRHDEHEKGQQERHHVAVGRQPERSALRSLILIFYFEVSTQGNFSVQAAFDSGFVSSACVSFGASPLMNIWSRFSIMLGLSPRTIASTPVRTIMRALR